MLVRFLQVDGFRNLQSVSFEPSSQFNIFYGENGAGKTSMLEAIYYLGLARSFRTSTLSRLIQTSADKLSLFARLQNATSVVPIGIERSLNGFRSIRYDGNKLTSIAPIAHLLPIQLISTDSYRYFHDGPKVRRQFLNWGLFHVEPLFFPLWQRLLQALKQRNAALKTKQPSNQVCIWDEELTETAEHIDKLRKDYVSQLQPILHQLLSSILKGIKLELRYSRGWSTEQSYLSALESNIYKDRAIGYTTTGPQRADLQLFIDDTPVQDLLSQGQQKLASYALYLAQGLHLREASAKTPIYLVDDLPSELDPEKRMLLTNVLSGLQAQVFISGITTQDLQDSIQQEDAKLFHVKQGKLIEN